MTTTPGTDVQVQPGIFLGTGVAETGVQREVDESLNDRLRAANSDSAAAATTADWVGQVQTAIGALSGDDLSTQMTTFFNAWSDVANNPTDAGQRQVTIQDGANLAGYVQKLSSQLGSQLQQVNQQLPQQVSSANALAGQVAKLNVQIVTASAGTTGVPNGLEDERDSDLKQLSQLTNISVQQQPGRVGLGLHRVRPAGRGADEPRPDGPEPAGGRRHGDADRGLHRHQAGGGRHVRRDRGPWPGPGGRSRRSRRRWTRSPSS